MLEDGNGSQVLIEGYHDRKNDPWAIIRQTLSRYFAIPLAFLAAFTLLGVLTLDLEHANPPWITPVRTLIARYLFATHETTGAFLGAIGGGLITMTSIIFSMLLLMLQQSASNMGNMVYDQFLSRHSNQVYVGIVVGSVILTVIQHAAVSDTFNPILGASVVLLDVFLTLVMLVYFLYSAINQMRPEYIVMAIKRRTLKAREHHLQFLARTRQERQLQGVDGVQLLATSSGHVDRIDLDHIAHCLDGAAGEVEVVIRAPIGTFVSTYDRVADVLAESHPLARQVAERLGQAFHFTSQRNLSGDPGYGLMQLEMVAWTEASSAKHNPETGLMVIQALRDLLACWMEQEVDRSETEALAVVYPDGGFGDLLDVLESLAVVSAESKQHQNYTEILITFAQLLDRFTPEQLESVEQAILRILPAFEPHTLVSTLDAALLELAAELAGRGCAETAARLYGARQRRLQQTG